MASKLSKKIKFALLLKDGKEVRTLVELRENFDIDEIMDNFTDGKLEEWLKDHEYTLQLECINNLRKCYDDGSSTPQIVAKQLCKTFDVSVDEEKIQSLDINRIQDISRKKDDIKARTGDKQALNHIHQVARNQDDLDDFLNKRKGSVIYLLSDGEEFYKIGSDDIDLGYKFIGVKTNSRNSTALKVFAHDTDALLDDDKIEKLKASCSNVELHIKKEKKHNITDFLSSGSDYDDMEEHISIPVNSTITATSSEWLKTDDSRKMVHDRLIRYMDAGFPLVYINTFEEDKADEIIYSVADGRRIFEWNAEGFFETQTGASVRRKKWKGTWDIQHTLGLLIHDHIAYTDYHDASGENKKRTYDLQNTILVLKDAHNFLKNDTVVAQLKYLSQKIYNGEMEDCNIIIVSPVLTVPIELENYLTILNLGYLTDDEIKELIIKFCKEQGAEVPPEDLLHKLVGALKGLSEFDIINILSLALSNDREITAAELGLVLDQKKRMIQKTNILQMIDVDESMSNLGGLEKLKEWLQQKAQIFERLEEAKAFGVTIPKGVLIAGMPGCGKSLCAKVTANEFKLPLLSLDMGRIMGKYVGESEANMRRALAIADAISPCILWIDEMEKAFSGIGGSESGTDVTMRLFGTFLTWLQEKKSAVFVVATANDATKLPSELLRKGRFDELFYVNLPNHKERQQIFKIHIQKRRSDDMANFSDEDIDALSKKSEKYSGADIEGVVRYAIEDAFLDGKQPLDRKRLEEAIDAVIPISKIKKGAIQSMKEMYRKNNFQKATLPDPSDADNPREKMKIMMDIKKQKVRNKLKKITILRIIKNMFRSKQKCGKSVKENGADAP